ncbi:MAG: hypothetical protein K8L99_18705 [Anaerolineae bacterium]|nr:hypothetical protein [Anaerolineae bacterium]
MVDTASLQKQGFRPYRKVGTTYAREMDVHFTVRIESGDVITGNPGDYVCVNAEDNTRWIVNGDIFRRTYAPDAIDTLKIRMGTVQHKLLLQGFKPYRKYQVTWAKRLVLPMTVHTLEGDVHARAGDYLCMGLDGDQWPQPAARFERLYEQVSTKA